MLSDRRSPSACRQHHVMHFREPTLSETLSDPIVQVVMLADGVDPQELEAMLMNVRAQIAGRSADDPLLAPHRRMGVV
jgi:hypothetical protein